MDSPNAENGGRVSIPIPPAPTAEQNAAAATSQVHRGAQAPVVAAPALPPMPAAPAPKAPAAPVAAAPAAPPPAAAPTPAEQRFADENAIIRTIVDGKPRDITVKDARDSWQIRTAAEKRLAEANKLQNEGAADIAFARQVRTALQQTNPQAALQELQRVTGRDLGVNTTEAEDDGTDPQIRDLKAKLALLENRTGRYDKLLAEQQVSDTVGAIRQELQKFPLYQQDSGEAGDAEIVVAAHIAQRPGMTRAEIADLVGELHARRSDTIQRATTSERNQRVASVAENASVDPASGTPGLSTIQTEKPSKEDWHNGKWKRGFDNVLSRVTRGT